MTPEDGGPAMAREYAAARFGEDRDRELIAAAFLAGWDARVRVTAAAAECLPDAAPVYRVAAGGEPPEDFPHTLDGLRAATDAAVLMGERTGSLAEVLSAGNGGERVIRLYDPEARAWREPPARAWRALPGGEM